ncbi:MAG: gliding motility-associated C-terminal domain-containing protein [Bacteroidota bacterium]|nr:gliding motility-associated C-terminal domain-containing protein [Bacteroidota bacterium]
MIQLRLTLIALLFLPFFLQAQDVRQSTVQTGVVFESNKGQWPAQVQFMSDIPGGRVFFENQRFTFVVNSLEDLEKAHENSHLNNTSMTDAVIRAHAYRMNFSGANAAPLLEGNNAQLYYRNYFIGNDTTHWASEVPVYKGISYNNLYPNIDLKAYSDGNNLKYDYLVYPGADVNAIRVNYEGVDKVWIQKGALVIQTSIGNVTEQKPVAWQLINGVRTNVKCEFVTDNKSGNNLPSVGFYFPDGYDKSELLVIDPILVASTYSGSTASNYGHCATYDAQGNIYTGAICFGQGYPVTTGAIQTTFGGSIDFAISKLSPTGSTLLYATYIGGTASDYPHSLVVSNTNELFAYGSTSSSNFPVTAGAFDGTYNGLPSSADQDIVVCHLNSTGTTLIGSTYVGGSGSDGNNNIYANYGDSYRGEIILDGTGNPYVASFSQSLNFPVTAGCYDNTIGGIQDAVVFKMNPGLTAMTWCTYLGGSDNDAGFGLRISAAGEVYVAGGTQSNNFPTFPTTVYPAYQGGMYDGYITLLNSTGTGMVSSTYFGTPADDEVFFIDLDQSGNVYVFGQSTGSIPISAGVYSNPGSPQFIAKLDPGLFTIIFATVFGGGNMLDKISPTAFLVDVCDHIYAAGWGQVASYPISSNALQPTTDGDDFYLLVLDQNATSMFYATYFGAAGGWEHVDGGTSRFDPNGIVYEAICQGASNMTTTTGAYSPNNMVGSYDVAVFKIDFQAVGVIAQAVAGPSDTLCVNQVANFSNGSFNATDYIWDFGDLSPLDTNASPSHIYTTPGTFTVTLIAIDSLSCNFADTAYLVMTILPLPVVNLGNDTTICGTVNQVLNATSPGVTYLWSSGATTPTYTATAAGIYWVVVDNGFCSATDTIEIFSFQPPNIGSDTAVCQGQSIVLDAGNPGATYNWNTSAVTQTITVNTTGIYWVDVSTGTCTFRDSIDVTVNPIPQPYLGNDTAICPGGTFTLNVTDPSATYVWSDGSTGMSFNVLSAGTYWVDAAIGSCTNSDTVNVTFLSSVDLGAPYSLCDASSALILDAGNPGGQYIWNTGETTQSIQVDEAGTYWVNIISPSNCPLSDTIVVTGNFGADVIYVPNTFTPNGDGKNELFCVVGPGISELNMQIYDRWGKLLFESNAVNNCWDGTYKGQIVQQDVYVVKLRFKSNCTAGVQHQSIRHVTVLSKQ